jgi:hypothetical protein
MAERFAALGLQPMGGRSYLAPVHRIEQQLVAGRSEAALTTAKAKPQLIRALDLGRDLVMDLSAPAAGRLDAPLVFVGYGLSTPGAGYDDFTGRKLKGAVLVAVEGAPEGLSPTDAARARQSYTAKALERSGALGLIVIRKARQVNKGVFVDTGAERQAFVASLDPALAETLFAGSGYSFAEIEALVKARRPLAGFALQKRFKARFVTRRRSLEETAALALLPGVDPEAADDYVVATTQVAPGGDNAEALLGLAARLKAAGPSRRPVLLAAVSDTGDGGAAARSLLAETLKLGRIAATFSIAATEGETAALGGVAESSLGQIAEQTARLYRIAFTPAPLSPAEPAMADAPMLALRRPAGACDSFDAYAAAVIHQTAQAQERPRWAPGAAFAPPPARAQEIDKFRLQMPINMKRIRSPSGLG